MTLKFNLDEASFSSLEDGQKSLYAKTETGYQLQVEGAVSKTKLEEFRTNNIELSNKLKSFDGVDIEKYKKNLALEQQLADKKLIEAGDIETLIANKTATITSDFEAKLNSTVEQNKRLVDEVNTYKATQKISDPALSAFAKYKIRPDAQKELLKAIKATFKLDGDAVVGTEDGKILTGKNGNLTIDEYISGLPEYMKISSNGGHGQGNQSGGGDKATSRRAAFAKLVK